MTDPIPSEVRVGGEMFAYINTGDYDTPTWVEIADVGDVTPADNDTEIPLNLRSNYPYMTWIPGMTDVSCEFQMPYKTGETDTVFLAIRNAKLTRTPLEFAFMDGPIATPGSKGLRAICEVMKFAKGEPIDGVVMVDVSLKPSARNLSGATRHPPSRMVIP
jgi:hypothetical protein